MILYFLGVFTSSTILLILYIYILSRQNVSKKEKVIDNKMKSDVDIDNSDFFRQRRKKNEKVFIYYFVSSYELFLF